MKESIPIQFCYKAQLELKREKFLQYNRSVSRCWLANHMYLVYIHNGDKDYSRTTLARALQFPSSPLCGNIQNPLIMIFKNVPCKHQRKVTSPKLVIVQHIVRQRGKQTTIYLCETHKPKKFVLRLLDFSYSFLLKILLCTRIKHVDSTVRLTMINYLRQAGAELCQAQEKLGLANPALHKFRLSFIFHKFEVVFRLP